MKKLVFRIILLIVLTISIILGITIEVIGFNYHKPDPDNNLVWYPNDDYLEDQIVLV